MIKNYDNWKLDTPDSYDYEGENTCLFCGELIPDGEMYCSKSCRRADNDGM